MEMPINDKLTIKEFAKATGLSESYVRSLISKGPNGEPPVIPTTCPVPGMKRPRLIDKSYVETKRHPNKTGRPRLCCQT